MPETTAVQVSASGRGAIGEAVAAAINDGALDEAVNGRTAHDELLDAATAQVAEIIDPDGALGLHDPASDELPGMPRSTRPVFEGNPVHRLEIAFKGTIDLPMTPDNIRLFERFKLGEEIDLTVTGDVVGRPITRKTDKDGIPIVTSRAVLEIHSFDTPDAG